MASTRGRTAKAKAVKSSESADNSGLGRSSVAPAIFYASLVILAVFAAAACLSIIANVKEAAAAEFGVGITIPPVKINHTAPAQNMTPSVNGTNISIQLPMTYNGTGLLNITLGMPSDWRRVTNIRINESGVIKSVTIVGNEMTWESNQSATDIHLIFDAAPPSLIAAPEHFNSTFFQKNLTIESDNSFTNSSASVEVNSSYTFYTLYWHNGTGFVDKTVEFNLKVSGGLANFSGFHTSTVLFRLEGSISCTESWSCTGWSDPAQCGTRTCTDANHCGTTNNKPAESATCETGTPPAAGGGGGGGGGAVRLPAASAAKAKKELLTVSRELIRLSVGQGEFKKTSFTITNTGKIPLRLSIWVEGVSDLATLDTSQTDLQPGASQTISLLVLVGEEEEPGVRTGRVRISGEGAEATIGVVINVGPSKVLFDVFVTIPQRVKAVLPGDSVVADIVVINLLGTGKVDVDVLYGIKNSEDKTVTSRHQTLAVETRASFAGVLDVPKGSEPGAYSVFALVRLNETVIGAGSDTFEVVSPLRLGAKGGLEVNAFFVATAVMVMVILFFSLISVVEIVSHHLPRKHVVKRAAKEAKAAEAREKAAPEKLEPEHRPVSQAELEKKLKAIEKAFDEGLVSTKAYIEDKFKLESELKKFQKQ